MPFAWRGLLFYHEGNFNMSGKYTKKKSKNNRLGLVAVIVIIALVCAAFAWAISRSDAEQNPTQTPSETDTTASQQQTDETEMPTKPVQIETLEPVSINLGCGMRITDVGKYTGVYMEDGTDEVLTGIMMIAVTNEGEEDIQYAQIALPVGEETASFTLSTLPVGSTVILLEQSRMEYVPGEYTTAVAENVVLFQEPMSLCEDRIEIQNLQGAMNVSNISGKDIEGDIYIYYKNSALDVYYGGITYRVRLEGGLKAGEIRQVVANHFSQSGSTVMFVTCGES